MQRVALTDAGADLLDRLREVSLEQDRRLRAALDEHELEQLGALLDKLRAGLAASSG